MEKPICALVLGPTIQAAVCFGGHLLAREAGNRCALGCYADQCHHQPILMFQLGYNSKTQTSFLNDYSIAAPSFRWDDPLQSALQRKEMAS